MYINETQAKNMICDIGRKMYNRGYVTSNAGNITLRTGENSVIVTPTGVSKGDLTPDMLLRVDMEGNVLEGNLKPTTETQMHLNIYRQNPEIVSTCHAHPLYLSAFSMAGIELDLSSSPDYVLGLGRVPLAPYEIPGSRELAESVCPYVKDYNIVLLANHGPIAWGKNPYDAWFYLDKAEVYAHQCILLKYVLKTLRPVSDSQIDELERAVFPVSKAGRLNAPAETDNKRPGRTLTSVETGCVDLSQASVEKIVDMLYRKLTKETENQ